MSDDVTAPDVDQEVTAPEAPDDSVLKALEPESEEEAVSQDDVAESEEPEETEGTEESDEDYGEDEVEAEPLTLKYRGKTLEVPPGTAPEVVEEIQKFASDIEASSTQKFQELAESRKALETRVADLDVIDDLLGGHQDLIARGRHVNSELNRLQGLDMNRMWDENPDLARQTSDRLASLQREALAIEGQVIQAEGSIRQKRESHLQAVREQGKQVIERVAKDFKPEVVIDHAVAIYAEVGMPLTKEQANSDWSLNPALALMAHESMLYRQQKAKAKTIGTKPKPKQVTAPVTSPKGRGSAKSTAPDLTDPKQMQRYLNG